MNIEYRTNAPVTTEQFIALLKQSTLDQRRPVDNIECIQGMINNSNLIVSAWHDGKLIGIARSVTDFHYVCYLSDLAIDKQYQNKGIGRKCQTITQKQLGPECKLIVIAAPAANQYYEKIGFTRNENCWVLNRNNDIK